MCPAVEDSAVQGAWIKLGTGVEKLHACYVQWFYDYGRNSPPWYGLGLKLSQTEIPNGGIVFRTRERMNIYKRCEIENNTVKRL